MEAIRRASRRGPRTWPLVAALLLPLLALPLLPPLTQAPDYHRFVDSRAALGIPSFANVASNAAFLVVGLMGVRLCVRRSVEGATLSWLTFFVAIALVAFGSSYYHLQPSDDALVWDRVPITMACMALFVALVCEHVDVKRESTLLAVAIAAGAASVVWWRATGDLKPYVWVQVAPFLAIAVLLATLPGRYPGRYWLAVGLGCYALAKIAEFGDAAVYAATSHAVSGHTLKHLLAALAPLCVDRMLRRRLNRPALL